MTEIILNAIKLCFLLITEGLAYSKQKKAENEAWKLTNEAWLVIMESANKKFIDQIIEDNKKAREAQDRQDKEKDWPKI